MSFHDYILNNEVNIRLSFFFSIFIVMSFWEVLSPTRVLKVKKTKRWFHNLLLVFFNSFVLKLLFPTAAVGVSLYAEKNGLGLLNFFKLPFSISIFLSIIIMDLIIYFQHVIFHKIPLLWRIHKVHHVDLDFDVTTGARFHTFEIILSMLIKFAFIFALGVPPVAVIIFEVTLNTLAMFNHSNVSLPQRLDKYIRIFIVTPDMHRVHHSVEKEETNSNYGFNLSIWDRLFGTYCKLPKSNQVEMVIGLNSIKSEGQANHILGMMKLPFQNIGQEYRDDGSKVT